MRISLFQKLFLAVLLSCSLVIATMGVLINASFKDGFQQYLNQEELTKANLLATKVSSYYSENSGWNRLQKEPRLWAMLLQQLGEAPPPREKHVKPEISSPRSTLFSPLSARLNLLNRDGSLLLGSPENMKPIEGTHREKVAIRLDNQVVGYITITQSESLTNKLAQQFLQSQTKHLVTISAAVIALSLIFALICVRYLLKPLHSLHQGANAVRKGNLDYQIQHSGNDEIADVTRAFNHLVESLKQQQQLRERWLSDISHELRTPLAVLRGELEALQDGIRQPEPAYIESLHQQVLTLTQLVDDLRAATKSDAQLKLEMRPVNLNMLCQNLADSYRVRYQEKQLKLISYIQSQPAIIEADQQKLTQVINNLLENSYRYTAEEGEVQMSLKSTANNAILVIEDSSPGVPDESLPKLCDRLYRVDQSRSREFGGSGLGLSICQNIIEAHNGAITLDHSVLGGLKVTVTLPSA